MTRTMDMEEIKVRLNEDLTAEEAKELANELVAHVEYWERAERSGTNFLVEKLKQASSKNSEEATPSISKEQITNGVTGMKVEPKRKTGNLIHDGHIIVQAEYEVISSGNQNYGIKGNAYLPKGWYEGAVSDRDFLVSFELNYVCEGVLGFYGEGYEENGELDGYYQMGSVHGLIDTSRALLFIHRLMTLEVSKTNTYLEEEDNNYAKSLNLLEDCTIEIKE